MFEFTFDYKREEDHMNKDELLNRIAELEEENNRLKLKFDDVKLFEEAMNNTRLNIYVLANWVGYAMFIKDGAYEKLSKDKQDTYHDVWSKCIRPMFLEFAGLEKEI